MERVYDALAGVWEFLHDHSLELERYNIEKYRRGYGALPDASFVLEFAYNTTPDAEFRVRFVVEDMP